MEKEGILLAKNYEEVDYAKEFKYDSNALLIKDGFKKLVREEIDEAHADELSDDEALRVVVTKEVEAEYEEEVDVGLFIQRIVKQKEMKKVLRRINNSNGINLIKMQVLHPDGKYMTYTNTTEYNLQQLMTVVLNIYQSKGYKAPQIEIVKFLNQKIKELIMVK